MPIFINVSKCVKKEVRLRKPHTVTVCELLLLTWKCHRPYCTMLLIVTLYSFLIGIWEVNQRLIFEKKKSNVYNSYKRQFVKKKNNNIYSSYSIMLPKINYLFKCVEISLI